MNTFYMQAYRQDDVALTSLQAELAGRTITSLLLSWVIMTLSAAGLRQWNGLIRRLEVRSVPADVAWVGGPAWLPGQPTAAWPPWTSGRPPVHPTTHAVHNVRRWGRVRQWRNQDFTSDL